MFDPQVFHIATIVFVCLSPVVFLCLALTKIVVPYGKVASSMWGSVMMPAKFAWIIMESPSFVIFIVLFFLCPHLNAGLIVLFFVWQFHYFYRSFIYPFLSSHSKPLPLAVMFAALSFQLMNTYFQAGWLFFVAPPEMYAGAYLTSWNFILGLILFFGGSAINRQADFTLKNLRKPGETEYKVPYGALYRYISCPNYFGEILLWLGWAVMLKSLVGWAFFLWTVANLAPRAMSTHKWYQEKFEDYPKDRKALIPFII